MAAYIQDSSYLSIVTHVNTDRAQSTVPTPVALVAEWVDSAFDSCLKDTGSNAAEAGHCVTTEGKLFTPTVPSGAEGRLNHLTLGIDGTSVATLHWLRSTQPFILNW